MEPELDALEFVIDNNEVGTPPLAPRSPFASTRAVHPSRLASHAQMARSGPGGRIRRAPVLLQVRRRFRAPNLAEWKRWISLIEAAHEALKSIQHEVFSLSVRPFSQGPCRRGSPLIWSGVLRGGAPPPLRMDGEAEQTAICALVTGDATRPRQDLLSFGCPPIRTAQ